MNVVNKAGVFVIYFEDQVFKDSLPVSLEVISVGEIPIHAHHDVLEIVFCITGSVKVKSGFEVFFLNEGDYIAINKEDSHCLFGTDEQNIVAVISLDLKHFYGVLNYAEFVAFACESFDLPKYNHQENLIREKLIELLLLSTNPNDNQKEIDRAAENFMKLLLNSYTLEKYYNRDGYVPERKYKQYYGIVKQIVLNYPKLNLLDEIAKNEFYSKSYISQIVKEVGRYSFSDALYYIRISKSEALLLDTNLSIKEIAEQCGFSEVKYYNRHFAKWFNQTPFEYRKTFQKEVGKRKIFESINLDSIKDSLDRFSQDYQGNSEYQVSLNPLALKVMGTKEKLYLISDQLNRTDAFLNRHYQNNIPAHALIKINNLEILENRHLLNNIKAIMEAGFHPQVWLYFESMTRNDFAIALRRCVDLFIKNSNNNYNPESPSLWLVYSDLGNHGKVVSAARKAGDDYSIPLYPLLIP
jgi:AraC-like DNA-binding protein